MIRTDLTAVAMGVHHEAGVKSNVGDLDATPLEWELNGRAYVTPRVYVGLGAGTRLTGGFAPDFRAVAVIGGSFGVTGGAPKGPGSGSVPATAEGSRP